MTQVQTKHLVQLLVDKNGTSFELAYDVELDKLVAFMSVDNCGGSVTFELEELERWLNVVLDKRGERR